MAFKTKEEIFEEVMATQKPVCPHCNQEMSIWEVPPINFSDGLGWGTPYLFVCFNDECPIFVSGWKSVRENYAHNASYRCMCYPGTETYEVMPVFSPTGAKGQIIDDQVALEQEMLKNAIKKGFSLLATCYVEKDSVAILNILLDSSQPARVRLKAAEMVGDMAPLEAIDPINNAKFGNPILQDKVKEAVKKIHGRFFTRECPFCAEVIKQRAKVCKHCGMELAGQ
jgi:ribosomal protein L37AE/L43A